MLSSIRCSRRMFLSVAAVAVAGTLVSETHAHLMAAAHPTPGSCLTADELTLAQLINDYRAENGLSSIAVSKSLSQVAQFHVIDLVDNNPNSGTDSRGMACNMHSWSANGSWTPVCYTSDHQYASGMWNKPREITNNIYTKPGYEIAFGGSGSFVATPQSALAGWKSSPSHNDVILNKGIWTNATWKDVGVGMYGGYAVVWFGEQGDPQGTLAGCATDATPTQPPIDPPATQDKHVYLPRTRKA